MKKITLFLTTMLVAMTTFVSCGKQEELCKSISSNEVEMSGKHSDLLQTASDSVKFRLKPNGKKYWMVEAVLPMSVTKLFDEVPAPKDSSQYYRPDMSLNIAFTDANGMELFEAGREYGELESLIKSEPGQICNLRLAATPSLKYKECKAAFEKIAGISISQMELETSYKTSNVGSSSVSSDDDDWFDEDDLDDFKKAVDAEKKMLKAAKSASDVIDAYEDVLDAFDDF